MEGVLVSSIPFTHPGHVPQILVYLRQQALFNSLLASCVRPMARQDPEHTVMFEVSALSWQHLSVSLEHPFEETMATAELDLSDISALKCKLYGVSMSNSESTSDLAGKVLQRCLSIPVTMRTLIKTWEGRNPGGNSMSSNGGNYNVNLGPGRDQNGHNGSGMPDFNNGDVKIKQEPGLNGNGGIGRQQSSSQQSFLEAGTENSIGFPSFSGSSDTTNAMLNPLQLGALLGQAKNTSGLVNPMERQSKKVRKRKTVDGLWRSPKRKGDDMGEIILESSSSDSTPLGTPTSRDNQSELRTPTPTSAGLASGLDLSNIDPSDILGTDKSSDYDMDNETEIMEVHDLQDVEELLKRDRKSKKREDKKSPNLFEDNKNLVPPSVSITPISSSGISQSSNYNSVLTGMGLERRPGIEIIPIVSSPQTSLPSSITITPIVGPASKNLNDERRDRKSSKNKTPEDKNKIEKKRKRKREDSPMGPPDKLPLKTDPLSKPVSVSIKPTESPPNLTTRPSSPGAATLRKFSPSPTHTSPLALVGKSSPTLKQPVNKPIQSPKHSPVYNSPKHSTIPASVSPKHGTSSPKHGSSASAGKPSMSALKSAANSPSSKSSDGMPKAKSSNKDSGRDKERKASSLAFSGSGHQSPKMKLSSGKLKQLDINPNAETPPSLPSSGGSTPPSGGSDIGKSATAQQQARNRKGSLSAVIDKLKNAQHCTEDGNGVSKNSQKDRVSSNKVGEGKSSGKTTVDTKNATEYMVKHSSEMKITFNKKGTKDSKSSSNLKSSSGSSSSSGNGSPKTHTGLKPGVNSGPASKKPQQQVSPKLPGSSGTGNSGKVNIAGQKVPSVQKSASGSGSGSGLMVKGISNKSSGSPKINNSGATDLSRNRDKPRPPKSGDKNIFGSKSSDARKTASPSALREESESERAFKLLAAHASMSNLPNLPPQLVVEGLMKQLDTKFQIPKLSARTNADGDKKPVDKLTVSDNSNNKILDSLSSNKTETMKIQATVSLANVKTDVQSKPDNLCTASSIAISVGNSSPSLIMPPPTTSPQDSELPTNLSMQPADTESREVKEARNPSQFLNCAPLNTGKEEVAPKPDPISAPKPYPLANSGAESLNLSTKPADAALNKYNKDEVKKSSSVTTEAAVKPPPSSQEAAEMLLDFSTPKEVPKITTVPERAMAQAIPVRRNTPPPPPPAFPPSPSVSVHIVKSPAPSPRVVPPSPHSASPCITDDELMDEALVGIGK